MTQIVWGALRLAAAAVMFALMLVTCVDVLGRYFLNRPLLGGLELTELLLSAAIFFALPLVSLRGDHVTVDLLDAVTPDWLVRIQHVFASLVGALCSGYLAWRLWIRAGQLVAAGETTAQLKLGLGGVTYAMSALMALTAVALVLAARRTPSRSVPESG